MSFGEVFLLLNTAAVLFMTGFIWTMQVVHYPLFDRVGGEAFPAYERDHNRLFFRVAGPAILLTLLTAVLLLLVRPPETPLAAVVAGLVLFTVVLVSTVLFQAPQHVKLSDGFDPGAHRFLVSSNWIRTAAWSLYALLDLWLLLQTLG